MNKNDARRPTLRSMAVAAGVLTLFAVVGVGLVALTEDSTHERIERNEREFLLRSLNDVLPGERYDNALFEDTIQVVDADLLGTTQPVTVYRARNNGRPEAVILTPVAPDGYSGAIRLLVGIDYDGTLTGVRVVAHRETPGLGDAIEVQRSDWILGIRPAQSESASARILGGAPRRGTVRPVHRRDRDATRRGQGGPQQLVILRAPPRRVVCR